MSPLPVGATVRPSATHAIRRSACRAVDVDHGKIVKRFDRYDVVDVTWFDAAGAVIDTEAVIAGTDLVRVRA